MSTFEVFNFKSIDRKPLIIGSLLFAVFLSSEISEFFSPSQVPTLGYYGKYGYKFIPVAVIDITRAVDIIYKITVTDVQKLIDSVQINQEFYWFYGQEANEKVKDALKRNTKYLTKYTNFVGLIKRLYRKAIKLSTKKEPQEIKELEQTVDDITRRAVSVLKPGIRMNKIIQD